MHDSWIYQGRQSHGWFGHGTAPRTGAPSTETGEVFDPDNIPDRASYVMSSILGHVPRSERGRWVMALSPSSGGMLASAAAAWQNARSLNREEFRTRLLDPQTSNADVDDLRLAAHGIVAGQTHNDLATAGDHLADVAQRIGPDRWPRFVAEAADRAAQGNHGFERDGQIRVLGTLYDPPPLPVALIATGDFHPDIHTIGNILIGLIEEVTERGRLTIPDTSSPTVYGTRLHTLLAKAVRNLNIPGLEAEASFIDTRGASYGELGTVRTDVVLRDSGGHVVAVWDWKTGAFPSMSEARIKEIKDAVGEKYGSVPIGVISTRLGIFVKTVP